MSDACVPVAPEFTDVKVFTYGVSDEPRNAMQHLQQQCHGFCANFIGLPEGFDCNLVTAFSKQFCKGAAAATQWVECCIAVFSIVHSLQHQ